VFGSEDVLLRAVSNYPCSRIVLFDLAAVTAIDAAGIGTLVWLSKWAKHTGRKFRLMNLPARIEGLLELVHLRTAFEICSVSEMLQLLCSASEGSEVRVGPLAVAGQVLNASNASVFTIAELS